MYSGFIMVVPNDIGAYPDIGKVDGYKTSYFVMPKDSELCIKGVIPDVGCRLVIKTDKPEIESKLEAELYNYDRKQNHKMIIQNGARIAMDENEMFFGIIKVPEEMKIFAVGARF